MSISRGVDKKATIHQNVLRIHDYVSVLLISLVCFLYGESFDGCQMGVECRGMSEKVRGLRSTNR